MYHRLRTVDLLIALECAVQAGRIWQLSKRFWNIAGSSGEIEPSRKQPIMSMLQESSENKIIPDAAYILENRETQRRALFFLEMDMGTERITSAYTSAIKPSCTRSFPSTTAILKVSAIQPHTRTTDNSALLRCFLSLLMERELRTCALRCRTT